MPEPLVVIGAGGFGREVLGVVAAMSDAVGAPVYDVVGIADDRPSAADAALVAARGVPLLGGLVEATAARPGVAYVVAVGDPATRRVVADRADAAGWRAATLVHPTVSIGDPGSTAVGEGSVLCANAMITVDTVLGRHVHLNLNAYVGHDCLLGDFVTLSPAAVVAGGCTLGTEVFLGTGAVLEPGVSLGAGAVVGAASLVTRDVAPGQVVKGVPAS